MGSEPQSLPEDKVRERIILLKRFLPPLEWDWSNEVKTKVLEYLGLPQNQHISLEKLAGKLTDAQLEHLIRLSPSKDYYTFRGKYCTVRKRE